MKKLMSWMALVLIAGSTSGMLLVYSGFDGITSGSSIEDFFDGIGWRSDNMGRWNSQSDTVGYLGNTTNPLYYGRLKTSKAGEYLSGGDLYTSVGRILGVNTGDYLTLTGRVSTPHDQPYFEKGVIDQGGALWFSILVRQNSAKTQIHLYFSNNHIPWQRIGPLSIQTDGGGAWTLTETTHGQSSSSKKAPLTGVSDLLIGRFNMMGSDSSVHLWVNPDDALLGGSDLKIETADASLTGLLNTEIAFGSFAIYTGSFLGDGDVDEIRFGETFADVTPISE